MYVIPFFAKSDQVSILGSIVDFPEWPKASYLRLSYFNELWGKAAGKTGEMWPPWGKGHPDISVGGSEGRLSSFCPERCLLTFLMYHQLSGCSNFGDREWPGTQIWSQIKRIQEGLCWFWWGFFWPRSVSTAGSSGGPRGSTKGHWGRRVRVAGRGAPG